jgi:type II secretory pathway component PulF
VRLLGSGLKPVESLRRLGLEKANPEPVFARAADALESGRTLSQALDIGAPGSFPKRDLTMLEAADITDTHVETLERLMTDHRRRSAVLSRFMRRMLYPALLIHAAAILCIVYIILGKATPLALTGLALAVVPFYAFLLVGWHFYRRYWTGLAPRDHLLAFPAVMRIVNKSELGNFFRLLYTLYGAGIRLDDAAFRAAELIRARSIREKVLEALAPLKRGEPLAACLENIGLPDDTYITRLSIGEDSGQLEEALKETAEELAEKAQARASALLTRISIFVTVLAYLGVVMILASHYVEYFGELQDTLDSIE